MMRMVMMETMLTATHDVSALTHEDLTRVRSCYIPTWEEIEAQRG